jgi:hypothetical protein
VIGLEGAEKHFNAQSPIPNLQMLFLIGSWKLEVGS